MALGLAVAALACSAKAPTVAKMPGRIATGTGPAACASACGGSGRGDADARALGPDPAKPDSSTWSSGRDASSTDGGDASSALQDAATSVDAAAATATDAATVSAASRAIAAPPMYRGSLDNGADCTSSYATLGFEPVDAPGTRHPLFLYFVGTSFVAGDVSSQYDSQAARAVTEVMARRGFVALSAQYDNGAVAWLSDHKNQLDCLFAPAQAANLLSAACALPQVDCDLGIATWGHSQGAYVAVSAANYDPRVRASWATGYGGDASAGIAHNRLRVVNGEADTTNGSVAALNPIAGFSTSECPDDGRNQCLRSDGSGWIIVQHKDVVTSSADHCWFDKKSCADNAETLEPNWIDPASTKPFALERNADWVAQTTRRR